VHPSRVTDRSHEMPGMPTSAKKLINDPDHVVEEMVCGVLAAHPTITRLAGTHVLLRADVDEVKQSQVTLVSGGGSGHEPSHAGWIGSGMLTAAVCGGVFASPSVEAVLSAVRAVAGPPGVLVIVKNYTGDRLNFGLAVEKAKQEGIRCEMVIVGDDCAVVERDEDKIAGRRGIAGTVLVHKCAGAVAAAGAPLAQVLAVAQAAEASVGSVGAALDACSLPGQPKNERIPAGCFELGLGIHGEPGTQTLPMESCDAVVERMIATLCDARGGTCRWAGGLPQESSAGERVVLLVNNLGATTVMEQCHLRNIVIMLRTLD
jgi:dihydroxyacetone kinase